MIWKIEFLNSILWQAQHDKGWELDNVKDMELVFYEMPLNQTPDSSDRKWRKTVNLSRVDGESFIEKFWSLCNDNKAQVITTRQ